MATPEQLGLKLGDKVFFLKEHTRAVRESIQKKPLVAMNLGRYEVREILGETVILEFVEERKWPRGLKRRDTVIISIDDDVLDKKAQM